MAAAALMLDNCESVLLCLESQKSVPAPFLTKTYQLVDDPESDHIVSWSEDTTTFVVWRPPEFARDLLPKYFKHNNFSSFVRQLNTYGFRKIIPDRWEFGNEFFRKGEKHLLSEIHRRKASHLIHHQQQPHQQHYPLNVNGGSGFFSPFTNLVNPSDSDELPMNRSDSSSPLSSPRDHNNNSNNSSSVVLLAEDNERLRLRNSMLMAELAHMKKLYNDIIFFVQNHVKSVPAPANMSNNYNPPLPPPSFHGGFNHQQQYRQCFINSNTTSSNSSLTMVDEGSSVPIVNNTTKLFGVNLHDQYPAKKRLHLDQVPTTSKGTNMSKVRLVDDLRLNLMSPSAPCS